MRRSGVVGSRRTRLGLAVLTLGASLLSAGGASGQGPPVLVVGGAPVSFSSAQTHGTNGYDVSVSGGGNSVTIHASQGHGAVSYSVRGRAGGKRLRADFGTLGSVNLRFHPRDRSARGDVSPAEPVPCETQETTQRGVWKGELRFIGEGGFTSAFATRLRGKVETIHFDCEPPAPPEPRRGVPERPILLSVTSFDRESRARTHLSAIRSDSQDISRVSAAVFVPRGRIRAGYSVSRNVPRKTMQVNRQRTRFHLEGVEPLTGEATFRGRSRHRGRWAGDLAVTLPVIGRVALTGPGFRATTPG